MTELAYVADCSSGSLNTALVSNNGLSHFKDLQQLKKSKIKSCTDDQSLLSFFVAILRQVTLKMAPKSIVSITA